MQDGRQLGRAPPRAPFRGPAGQEQDSRAPSGESEQDARVEYEQGGRHGTNTSRSRTLGTKGLAAARRTREKHGTEDEAEGAEEAKDPGHELGKGDV